MSTQIVDSNFSFLVSEYPEIYDDCEEMDLSLIDGKYRHTFLHAGFAVEKAFKKFYKRKYTFKMTLGGLFFNYESKERLYSKLESIDLKDYVEYTLIYKHSKAKHGGIEFNNKFDAEELAKNTHKIINCLLYPEINLEYILPNDDEEWVLRHNPCPHVKEEMELEKVIFYCEDGKIRCSKCLFDSKINRANPIMKIDDENRLMLLLTHTYEPQNLEFIFNCDDNGIKGEEITLNLTIMNNKLHDIEDININIEAFAAEPLPENTSLNIYREQMYSRYLILKTYHFDEIKSKKSFKIELKVKIPKDGEIKKNQFVNISEDIENEYVKDEVLNVPDKLMIYVQFTYKTYSGFKYWSYVESDVVNLD